MREVEVEGGRHAQNPPRRRCARWAALSFGAAAFLAVGACASAGGVGEREAGASPPAAVFGEGRRVTIEKIPAMPAATTPSADPKKVSTREIAEVESAMPVDDTAIREGLRDLLRVDGYDAELVEDRKGDPKSPAVMGRVIVPRVAVASLRRNEHAESGAEDFVFWFFFGFFSSFRGDRAYELVLDARLDVENVYAQPLAHVEVGARVVEQSLSLIHRREGVGAIFATVVMVPPFAFGSTPREVVRSLAPKCLKESIPRLKAELNKESRYILLPSSIQRPDAITKCEVTVEPSKDGRLLSRQVTIRYKLAMIQTGRKFASVSMRVGEKGIWSTTANDFGAEGKAENLEIDVGRPIDIVVQTKVDDEKAPDLHVYRVEIREELEGAER